MVEHDKHLNCGFTRGDNWFRYRAAAIIIEDDCILLIGNDESEYLYSIGGAVHLGEAAEQAILREVYEETGVRYEIDRLAVIHENFFGGDEGCRFLKSNCHEIAFYFIMKPQGRRMLKCTSYDACGVKEFLKWVPLADLGKVKVYPKFFTEEKLMNLSDSIEHIVYDERI